MVEGEKDDSLYYMNASHNDFNLMWQDLIQDRLNLLVYRRVRNAYIANSMSFERILLDRISGQVLDDRMLVPGDSHEMDAAAQLEMLLLGHTDTPIIEDSPDDY